MFCPVSALNLIDGDDDDGGADDGEPFLVYATATSTRAEDRNTSDNDVNGQGDCAGSIIRPGGRRRVVRPATSALKMDPSTGALIVPHYTSFERESCALLKHAYRHMWQTIVEVSYREPQRALHKTTHTGRTALHLALIPKNTVSLQTTAASQTDIDKPQLPLPVGVAKALLIANRHMVLSQDHYRYTPVHLMAHYGFGGSGQAEDDGSTALMQLLCDTAVMVEQELQGNFSLESYAYGASPLYLAAKRRAPVTILRTLLQTRCHRKLKESQHQKNDHCRTQQAEESGATTLSYIAGIVSNTCIMNGDHANVVSSSSWSIESDKFGRSMKGKPHGYWIAPSTGSEPYWDSETMDEYSSPLEVMLREANMDVKAVTETIQNNDSLKEAMRQMAQQRFSTNRHIFYRSGSYLHQQRHLQNGVGTETTVLICKESIEILGLWERCLELLVNGGYCPLLQIDGSNHAHLPYGILHCCVACKVPVPALVQLAVATFPEQTLQRDEHGLLPLHHVLRARYKYATSTLVKILLSRPEFCPAGLASFPGKDGPTPVAFCLKNRLPIEAVVNKILQSTNHSSLHVVDPETKLYPFGLVAISAQKPSSQSSSEQDCESSITRALEVFSIQHKRNDDPASKERGYTLTDIYCLLRQCPEVLLDNGSFIATPNEKN